MNGRDSLVTGAGRGLGHEFVRQLLARADTRRVYASVRGVAGEAALAGLASERLRVLRLDVTEEASVAAAADAARAQGAEFGALLNVAGVLHEAGGLRPERRLAEVEAGALLRAYAVNAVGPLLVAKHFAPLLARSGRAVVANLSARVGSIGDNRLGGWYAYRASKAAQNMLTRNLAIELARRSRDLIVVALHPGTVATDLSAPFRAGVPEDGLFDTPRAVAQLLAVIDGLSAADTGGFFAWDGSAIPW